MKLIKNIISLCLVSATFGFDVSSLENIDITNPDSIKCATELALYSECIDSISNIVTTEVFDICTFVESEKCKGFYANIDQDSTQCANTMPEVEIMVKTLRFTYYGSCIKDESGKLCPFQKNIAEKTIQGNSTEIDDNKFKTELIKNIEDSCYSEKCVEGIKITHRKLEDMVSYIDKNNEKIGKEAQQKLDTSIIESGTRNLNELKSAVNQCKITNDNNDNNQKTTSSTSDSLKLLQWSGLTLFSAICLFIINNL